MKVILKVLPGKAVRRADTRTRRNGGEGAGAGSSRGSELALQLLEAWVQTVGCDSTWSWCEEGGKRILGEAGGAWTITTTRGHFFIPISEPCSVVNWDLSGALVPILSALPLWVPTSQAHIGVQPTVMKCANDEMGAQGTDRVTAKVSTCIHQAYLRKQNLSQLNVRPGRMSRCK